MLRPVSFALVVAVAAAGCSGGDDTASLADKATAASMTSAAPLTVPDVGDRCETVPDPADYLDGEVPAAIRPCDLPTSFTNELIRPGTGRVAQPGDGVTFDVTVIRSETGEVVESSWEVGAPAELPVVGRGGAPTEGLDDGLVGTQAGEMLRLDVPPELAYGDTPPGDGIVQPGDALTYVIEVLAVTPVLTPEDAPLDLSLPTSTDALEVTTTDLAEGDGKVVEEGDTVIMAALILRGDNLAIFYNSWDRRAPLRIPLDPALLDSDEPVTLPGIFEGVQGARVGGRRVITMPPSEAFGDEGQPIIGLPANTDVIVVTDILGAY